ncbi:MAG: hypothetical protein H6585_10190 [Flavobacteriales bacterium]|nr:hypothetical protein [Flavobacteriales bacterium]
MKGLLLLILLTAMSFTAFSQALTPKVQLIDGDTVFCFSIEQSRIIAKHLEKGKYCDSLVVQHEQNEKVLKEAVAVKDSTIEKLESKTENLNSIIDNDRESMEHMKRTIDIKDKEIRKQKFHKRILGVAVIVIGIIAII